MKALIRMFMFIFIFILLISSKIFSQNDPTYISGSITGTETWQGTVYVTGSVAVEEGAILIIEPGTKVFIKSDRNYKSFEKGGIFVTGGTIKAIGTPSQIIWFTSDNPDPINGDWGGIEISNSSDSEFKYCIVEYAELGIAQYFSSVDISHSIVRWNNSEGIYAENSTATFQYNRLYANAYHEIALENNNVGMLIRKNEFGPQNRAIIFQTSSGTLKHNYIHDYKGFPIVDVTLGSVVTADSNLFENCPPPVFNSEPLGTIDTTAHNDFNGSFVEIPIFGYPDTAMHVLDYVPGDTTDRYPYVYDTEDETRKIIRRYGKELGFGWSIGFANGYIWKHDTEHLSRIDTTTGVVTQFTNSPLIEGPGGLTHDGTYFWAYDRNEPHNISKFEISGDSVHVLQSFPAPESTVNRALGLTTDSTYLYQMSVNQPWIYKINMNGSIVDTIFLSSQFADLVVWTGDGFWGTGGEKGWGKWSPTGDYLGAAFPVANGCWAMAYDGEYLWSMNRTCELWNDHKIFKTKILSFLNITSVKEIEPNNIPKTLTVYPNPSSQSIFLNSPWSGNLTIEIFSLDGSLVYQQKKQLIRSTETRIDISKLPKGFYILKITTNNKQNISAKFGKI
mgnify:CR=1 FL=1